MNELLLLSKEYIEKDDFTSEINISNHHFELGGNDDQLWLIDEKTNTGDVIIDLLFKDEFGNVIVDKLDHELYEGTNAPYISLLYSIEYRNIGVMREVLKQINKKSRDLYVEYNGSRKFIKIK